MAKKTPTTAPDPAALHAAIVPFAAYPFDHDDAMLLDEAGSYSIVDQASYVRGFEVLRSLADLEKAIDAHHDGWRKPLNAFRTPALEQAKADVTLVTAVKDRLARALPAWKRLADERDAEEARRRQAEADAAAAAVQAARVAALEQVAQAEADQVTADSLRAQAAAVAAVPPVARPVAAPVTAITPRGGVIPVRWSVEVDDVRALLKAWLDGKVQIDMEAELAAVVASKLRDSAGTLGEKLGAVYPGCRAVRDEKAHVR